jgi:lipopolysaccharide/colanic/teichoic acid biosynthesis glycosyltransferase
MRLLRLLLPDLCLIVIATLLAVCLRDNFDVTDEHVAALIPYMALSVAVASIVLPGFGVVGRVWRFTHLRDYFAIVAATVSMIIGAVALGFIFNRLEGIARALPILQGVLIVCFLVGARAWTRVRPAGGCRRLSVPPVVETVLLIGGNKLTEFYFECASEFAPGRFQIAGILDERAHVGLTIFSYPVLGAPEQIADVLRELDVRGVFVNRIVVGVSLDRLSPAAREALRAVEADAAIEIESLSEKMGFDLPKLYSSQEVSTQVDEIPGDTQVFAVIAADAPAASSYCWVKRAFDVVISSVLLIALSPLMALVSILVALDVGLPVLFWQQRPGRGGRPFRVYKFRTMGAAHDAHGRRRPDAERISAIGSFLRRSRLDELPQLFSILVGHMSFVGPRPLLPVDQSAAYSARLLVRPGLTGWAQIKGGRTISAIDKAALDVWYVHNVSFALDINVLLATIPMVLFGERVTHRAIVQAWRDLQAAGICAATDLTPEPAPVLSDR